MSYETRDYFQETEFEYGERTRSLTRIVFWACIGMFAVEVLTWAILGERAMNNLIGAIGLVPQRLFRDLWVWQPVSYQFLHAPERPFHIIFNLLILWFFGQDLEVRYGRQKYAFLLLGAGIFGGLIQAVIQHFMLDARPVIGLSGACMGLLACAALLWPDRQIILFIVPVKLKWAVLILVSVDVYAALISSGNAANLAHLGGAAFGALIWRFEGKLDGWMSEWAAREHRRKARHQVEVRRRVDELLEKISREGMPSLSNSEREFLKKASREFRELPRG